MMPSRRRSYAGQPSSVIRQPVLDCRPRSSNSLCSMDENPGFRRSRSVNLQGSENDLTYSQQSIFNAMDRFVESVSNMQSSVLVPSRLKDMELKGENTTIPLPPSLATSDLYSFYSMLTEEKKQLFYGLDCCSSCDAHCKFTNHTTLEVPVRRKRQPSESSSYSTASFQDSDSESDMIICDNVPGNVSLSSDFRHHLKGLHAAISEMAQSANYVSARYQEDIGA